MKTSVFLVVSMIWTTTLFAQKTAKIDQLFEDWNQENHPGGVVYVAKEDNVLYSKAFGLANVQYSVPNTLESIFNLASVSKQFTALGIALLHIEGKLSIDDSIQKYLPELPDFGHPITIRHLLHHTSGLRSTPELFALAGWREGDAISTEDVFSYMCKQTDLNFVPGSEFMYSNTNYVLLALIISRVTQQDFPDWMKSNVFDPLGMSSTFIDASNLICTTNTSSPYMEVEENHFLPALNSSLDLGASNVYSSAPDLMKWLAQINHPEKKWEKAIELLLTNDPLTNGTFNEYAFGLITDEFNGNKRIYHAGGIPGYLSFTMNFPDEQISVVVLTNYLDHKAHQRIEMLLSLMLDDKSANQDKPETIKTVPLNIKSAENFVANYWNNRENYARSVYLENDTLWYLRTNGFKSPLFQIEDSIFLVGGIKATVRVKFVKQNGLVYMNVKDGIKPEQTFEPYDNSPPTSTEFMAYCGTYYSPELETSYSISMNDQALMGYHSRHGFFDIEVLRRNLVSWSGMAVARYEWDDQGAVTGFYVTMDRMRNVWFEKRQ